MTNETAADSKVRGEITVAHPASLELRVFLLMQGAGLTIMAVLIGLFIHPRLAVVLLTMGVMVVAAIGAVWWAWRARRSSGAPKTSTIVIAADSARVVVTRDGEPTVVHWRQVQRLGVNELNFVLWTGRLDLTAIPKAAFDEAGRAAFLRLAERHGLQPIAESWKRSFRAALAQGAPAAPWLGATRWPL